jgi:AcrR family transcriptional regulator
MPRKRDAQLEGRILAAAYKLWTKGGEKALTMRAVARASRTTTPTVYERFRDKRDLVALLRQHGRAKAAEILQPAATALETCRKFLEYAAAHRNEYRLLTADWAVRLSKNERKPTFDVIKARLAQDLGGTPEQHERLALALGEMLHGTATMLLADGVKEEVAAELRLACMTGCEALIHGAASEPQRWPGGELTAR